MNERRRVLRLPPADYAVRGVRLRPGQPAELVDLSADGACLESARRLLPGTHVNLHIERASSALTLKALVLRCAVVLLTADRLWYRAALQFTMALPWNPESESHGNSFSEYSCSNFPTERASDTRLRGHLPRVHEDNTPLFE